MRRVESDAEYAADILQRLPLHFMATAKHRYQGLYEKNRKAGNLYLLDIKEAIENCAEFDLDMTDDDIYRLAVKLTDEVSAFRSEMINDKAGLFSKLHALAIRYNVRYPHEFNEAQQLARLADSMWWVQRLRVAAGKYIEGVSIDCGMVHKKKGAYISEDGLERRAAQHRRNAKALENVEMVNTETGELMRLADIVKSNESNIDNRKAELLTRVHGFEELAKRYNHAAQFVTVTCPAYMHAVLANGKPNPKYDGTRPDEAQRWLVLQWARVRAKLKRENIKCYGLRIAEPHHDATPHWHMILFTSKKGNSADLIKAAFEKHFLSDADELPPVEKQQRLKNGLQFVKINPLKGSATGYVLKYIMKNVGGIDDIEQSDEVPGQDTKTLYNRVEAWAGLWRIRQFQQIGGHYVSVWRELRRIEECKLEGLSPTFVKTWKACQKRTNKEGEIINADFASYIEHMGGLDVSPRDGRLMVDYEWIDKEGRYGATIVPKVLGVGERFGKLVARTSRAEWVQVN